MGGKWKEWKVLSSLICSKWNGRLGWNIAALWRDLAIDHRNVVMIFAFLSSDSESVWLQSGAVNVFVSCNSPGIRFHYICLLSCSFAHTETNKAFGTEKPTKFAFECSVPFLYLSHLLNCRTLAACLCVPKFFPSGITEDDFFHIFACGSAAWLYNTAKHHSKFWWTILCLKTFIMEKKKTIKNNCGKVSERTLRWFGIIEQRIKSCKQSPVYWGQAVYGLWPYPFLIFSWFNKKFLRQVRHSS